ncbi:MAG: transcription-repair coupling factor [Sphingobacteriales bacterium]|jgi:transcription-repair coupling factor (superfamily II helicase)|nr:transcription-repair coupling factor [Sphingobacteriales bacterium]MBK7527734.1 transcription-repair coupling factor [Sphingobacteriales bacterium]MBP9140784.1 transcription-repair coupling factor [Chitinophagales bacterium]MCC7055994.1 transcription-repair coupling factor [Chitinophagales bacterium]MDA0199433.1 transcription-repair coupling factor [Bacteroidota bacterium]
MDLQALLTLYRRDARTMQIAQIATSVEANTRIYLNGLVGSQSALVAVATWLEARQTHLFVLENKETAAYFQNDLTQLLEQHKDALFFPDSFKKPGFFEEVNRSNVLLRTETISRLVHSYTTGELIVTYPEALFEKVVNTKALDQNTLHIEVNLTLDTGFMTEFLSGYGFEYQDFVAEPGQFSIRGGIIDVFSYGNDLPYRIELFGNEVESIRVFDPLTQLSVKKIAKVTIIPNIQTQFNTSDKVSLFQILPPNTIVWIKSIESLLHTADSCQQRLPQTLEKLPPKTSQYADEHHPLYQPEPLEAFNKPNDLLSHIMDFSIIEFGTQPYFTNTKNNVSNTTSTIIDYPATPQPSFNKNFELLIANLKANHKKNIVNVLFAGTPRQVNRFNAIFDDLKTKVPYYPLVQALTEGFTDQLLGVACYTDHQIFNRYYKYQIKQGYSKDKAMSVRMLRDLQPRDYVTHIDHGIGIYAGLVKLEINGQTQEVIKIFYKDNDVLYVNINSLHKVSKYIGKEGQQPKINRIGSDAWATLKRKAKTQIKDIAADLIKLYAARKATKGFAFNPDTYLQTELEASFIYEDTPDQIKATAEVKADMENQVPMDRLVCGDVGFGKTEIAIRAAAKAIADSKQVAVLAPTTILTSQHYQTFADRLKDFPCKVGLLNRFRTAKERTETLKQTAEGKIDILIGTHALLSETVKFKDLGLLIIDEEQKFGVAAKEKLRNRKVNVDTLTLTATPIPRTLQFSLMAARDLTVIATPPPNRQPVQTELTNFDDDRIRDAINYEVGRAGQVFFVHNRVKDLPSLAETIKRLCPDIDVGIAHGQMEGKDLENHMMKFIKGGYDVLVSTNIVEAGLDVPNANTIFISNAHQFGLSDLHQLRGRVGRSNRKAFCYLMTPGFYGLPDDARRRLKAIEQFSELGSGFDIAMRDLDIRGAGNLLGAEQSGFIADIGFDMYQKILAEAISELKETDFIDLFQKETIAKRDFVRDCQIDTDIEMLIPDEYISNINERLLLYTELDNIKDENSLQKFADSLRDRFGPIAKPVVELFEGVRLRWLAKKLGFERISLKLHKLRCYFVENQQSAYYASEVFGGLLNYAQQSAGKVHFKETNKHFMVVIDEVRTMKQAHEFLQDMDKFVLQNTNTEI